MLITLHQYTVTSHGMMYLYFKVLYTADTAEDDGFSRNRNNSNDNDLSLCVWQRLQFRLFHF